MTYLQVQTVIQLKKLPFQEVYNMMVLAHISSWSWGPSRPSKIKNKNK